MKDVEGCDVADSSNVLLPKSSSQLCYRELNSIDSRKVKISNSDVDWSSGQTPQTLSSVEVNIKSSGSLAVKAEPLLRKLETETDPGRIQELRDKLWPLIHALFDVDKSIPILEKLPRQRLPLEQVKQVSCISGCHSIGFSTSMLKLKKRHQITSNYNHQNVYDIGKKNLLRRVQSLAVGQLLVPCDGRPWHHSIKRL